jgi:hypothetical protein
VSSERKVETIAIGGGVQYAKVAARSAEFHKDNEKCSIETTCEFKEGYVLFCAKVTTSKGVFTGHSMDKVGGRQKQFEKQETIAVGRALAFAGYLATGEIACAEEMEDVVTEMQLNSLKGKYATVHAKELRGLERPQKQAAFSHWCKTLVGEDVDYNDKHAWCREWYEACWKDLIGTTSDVPFEA